MSGGGIGATLGSLAGAALAPETGGLSLLIPAIAGAGGGFLGGQLTGSQNPLMDALMGGIGGGLTGAINPMGIENSAGLFGDAATGAAGAAGAAVDPTALYQGFGDNATALSQGFGSGAANIPGATQAATSAFTPSPSSPSGIMGYLGKQNPLSLALAGTTGLSAIQSLMPHQKVDIGQNAANVMATNPSFNAPLPKYSMQNTATPYSGNWYTYGESPQQPMYNAMPQPVAQGGLVGYAKGGTVKGYAMGGTASPQPMPPQTGAPAPQLPVNPLTLKVAHTVGVAIGKHIKKHSPLFTGHGQVNGQGGGQDDKVPAKLSQGEYVTPADIIAHLGDGSSSHGAKVMRKFENNIRKHKTAHKGNFPPKAKNPLSYLPKGVV